MKLHLFSPISGNSGVSLQVLLNNRAMAYLKHGGAGTAEKALDDCWASTRIKENAKAAHRAGLAAMAMKDFIIAVSHFDVAIELDPQNRASQAKRQECLDTRSGRSSGASARCMQNKADGSELRAVPVSAASAAHVESEHDLTQRPEDVTPAPETDPAAGQRKSRSRKGRGKGVKGRVDTSVLD
jgi:hypothetical protein